MEDSVSVEPLVINGTLLDDFLPGTRQAEWLFGSDGDDLVYAAEGDDVVYGGTGNDSLLGGSGNDLLTGQTGNDLLVGGSGNDHLSGELGNDILIGGSGSDAFVFNKRLDGAVDVIADFSKAEGDKILIFALPLGASSVNQFFYDNGTGFLSFNNTHLASLSPALNLSSSDFLLV